MKYQIYLNRREEAGLLTGMADGYRAGDPMDLADAGDIEGGDNQDVLNALWRIFNLLPPTGYRGRSLSVGDVIVLGLGADGVSAYAVSQVGFQKLASFHFQVPSGSLLAFAHLLKGTE